MTYLNRYYNRKETPQSQRIPGSNQVPNSAGGFAWNVDDWQRLDRFLVLGSEGGTYYIGEKKLTLENAEAVERCIKSDGPRVVKRIIEISDAGRAPKNDPALFALAMCASIGDEKTRKVALASLSEVARIGTHLFHFISYAENMRGWGRGLKRAVGDWYNERDSVRLAFQAVKYQQRDGWSHADLLRLAHPKPATPNHDILYKWIVDKEMQEGLPGIIQGFERAQRAEDERDVVRFIGEYGLTMEMIPTQFKSSVRVQEALLPHLGYTALMRNLGNFSKSGLLGKASWTTVGEVASRLTNEEAIQKSRVHPFGILTALMTYKQGHGTLGRGEWEVNQDIVDALNGAFYTSFGNVTSTGKRLQLAIDVSGSMGSGDLMTPGMTPMIAAAAMAMVTYKVEPKVALTAFQGEMVPFDISRCSRLSEVLKTAASFSFGPTDCAQPMIWALEGAAEFDVFILYTDHETWCGSPHPAQALNEYRRKMGIPAKMIVVAMTSNGFTIADPDDAGMLDVVGFDSAVPEVMSQFITG